MVQFDLPFHFSTPDVPFVPTAGPDTELFVDDEVSNQASKTSRRSGSGTEVGDRFRERRRGFLRKVVPNSS
jgi:hypothetical protein